VDPAQAEPLPVLPVLLDQVYMEQDKRVSKWLSSVLSG
jgi:hypothetical protein